jgi:hypothetical protein
MPIKLVKQYGENRAVTFPAYDNKGRQFGASASITDHHFRPFDGSEGDHTFDYADPDRRNPITVPTIRYGFRPHATRNGQLYGSSHGTRLFDTPAERDAAIEAYFVDAEKRALKNKARSR